MARSTGNGTAFELSGPDGAPVVALIHGLGLNRHVWRDHVPLLEAHYRVLQYDLYGHGESAAPPDAPSLRVFAEQLRGVMDELGIARCAAAGFSLGGMINRRLAMDHPGRVSALAILNSPHERGPDQQRLVEERAADSAAGGPAATLDATIERWFTPQFRATRPDYIAQVRGWVLANDPAVYAQCRLVLAKGVVELIRPKPPISHPTLVMTGQNDRGSTPAMAHAIGSEIAGAQVIIVPRLQHMGLVEEPLAFAGPLLAFLDRVVPQA